MSNQDYMVPRSWFTGMCGITHLDFKKMLIDCPELDTGKDEYPVFQTLKYWYNQSKQNQKIQKTVSDMTDDDKLMMRVKKQNLLKMIISNMSKLYLFVPKSIAEGRSLRLLNSISIKIRQAINSSAVEISKMGKPNAQILKSLYMENPTLDHHKINNLIDPSLQEPRRIIELLTSHYNLALVELFNQSKNISWADESSAQMIKKVLLEASEEDDYMKEIVDELYETSASLDEMNSSELESCSDLNINNSNSSEEFEPLNGR
jgi:hypothetical protein